MKTNVQEDFVSQVVWIKNIFARRNLQDGLGKFINILILENRKVFAE